MALFDVLEEISEKNIIKTETGDNRIFGVVLGEVVDNFNENRKGRICVSIHTRDKNANVLKWARVAMPYMGKEWGHYFMPEIGDQVLVAFEQGNIEKPYIIGCIPKDTDSFLKEVKGADDQQKNPTNPHKKIKTKHGNTLYFLDAVDGDGTKDKIQLFTAGENNAGTHMLEMDNEKKIIQLKDKENKCLLEMKTEKGQITLTAAEKIIIKAGDKITMIMDGNSGKITINTTNISLEAQGQMKLNATGKAEISGANINVDSSGSVTIGANGMTTIGGNMIKIG